MSILAIGRSGQIARALVRRATARGVELEALGRPEIDLEDPERVLACIKKRTPSVVINAAAYTSVDRAEDEAQRASAINAVAPGVMAGVVSAPFLQVSTDYVFAGDKSAPYVETDATDPTGVYGATKLDGERRVLEANPNAIVLRTAWVFDATGSNFVRTMLRLAKSRDEVSVVADQVGCPTFADDFADAALTVALRPAHPGVFHCAGAGEVSWAGFAAEIFAQARARGGPSAAVRPIATADYPTRAKRPANSRLDCAKLKDAYGVVMRPWQAALSDCMDEIARSGWRVE